MPLRSMSLILVLSGACFLSNNGDAAWAVEQIDTVIAEATPKLLLKPGQPLNVGMQTEDIVATYDVNLAKEQVAAYPDSPEAGFVLAVALTRTSMVEEALHQVRRARKLAENKGGPAYFDHMISEYEEMLKSYPNDNRVRYGLAWAYYMKAYVLTHYTKTISKNNSPLPANITGNSAPSSNWHNTWVQSLSSATNKDPLRNESSKSEEVKTSYQSRNDWHNVPPELVPQVKSYYECALSKLDELLVREPNDIWARSYRAFLYAEYSGDLNQSIEAWKNCLTLDPKNPAAYFFLGESYLQQGNLKECLQNISKAIALRALPN
jgi:tetratricopeptide (TPR) repeat protein